MYEPLFLEVGIGPAGLRAERIHRALVSRQERAGGGVKCAGVLISPRGQIVPRELHFGHPESGSEVCDVRRGKAGQDVAAAVGAVKAVNLAGNVPVEPMYKGVELFRAHIDPFQKGAECPVFIFLFLGEFFDALGVEDPHLVLLTSDRYSWIHLAFSGQFHACIILPCMWAFLQHAHKITTCKGP